MAKKWESYEDVAAYLLDQFATEFGLERVEGKQSINGERSGTEWEIDAKGFRDDNVAFVIVECRRYLKSKQSQAKLGELAYRIMDAGADGGILVSPLGFQEGAAKVAKAENIIEVRLNPDSTRCEYVMQFLNRIMAGVQDTIELKEVLTYELGKRRSTDGDKSE